MSEVTDGRTKFDIGDDIATTLHVAAKVLGDVLRDRFDADGGFSFQFVGDTVQITGGEFDILAAYKISP
jgi:hypothetical protein